jgi:hypothetical protein
VPARENGDPLSGVASRSHGESYLALIPGPHDHVGAPREGEAVEDQLGQRLLERVSAGGECR